MLPLRVRHKGRTSKGDEFVGDGTVLALAELVRGPAPERSVEIATPYLDALVGRRPACWWPMHALVPSHRRADVLWAPGDVALSARMVGVLRALNRPFEVGPSGPRDPVLVREGDRVVAVLPPLDFAPDRDLASPAAGFLRGRVQGFAEDKGFGQILLEDGRAVLFDVSARTELVSNGDLVDLELTTGRDGRPRAKLAWRAGTPDPRTERPVERAPREPDETRIPAGEALAEAHRNGLLLYMNIDVFDQRLQDVSRRPLPLVDSADVAYLVLDQPLGETPGVLAVSASEGLIVGRDVHEGEEPEVEERLSAFAAHFGVLPELSREIAEQRILSRSGDDDLLDEENIFLLLGRAFARARRRERVFSLHAPVHGFAVLVRPALIPGALRLFQRATEYRPEDDWRRFEIGFLPAHGVDSPPPPLGLGATLKYPLPPTPVLPASPAQPSTAALPPTAAQPPAAALPPTAALPPSSAIVSPPPAAAASTLHLERFEMAARKVIHAAQQLADGRGHVNLEPLHIAIVLVERDIDPARSRVALQIGEQSLARLPKAPAGEKSYLSPATLALLKEVDRLAEGRPADVRDLWRAIRRSRGSSAAIVLEAAAPD